MSISSLKNQSAFDIVNKNGGKLYSSYCTMVLLQDISRFLPHYTTTISLGMKVSKKLGNAVIRNKIKRRIRHLIRDALSFYTRKVTANVIGSTTKTHYNSSQHIPIYANNNSTDASDITHISKCAYIEGFRRDPKHKVNETAVASTSFKSPKTVELQNGYNEPQQRHITINIGIVFIPKKNFEKIRFATLQDTISRMLNLL